MRPLAALALAAAACAAVVACTPRADEAPAPPAPARIASLNLAADEILVELVPTDRLVMVTSFADDPDNSNVVGRVPPGVARVTRAKMERLVEARPDVTIVSEYTEADFLHLLSLSKIAYYQVQVRRMDEVPGAILGLGRAVGAETKAAELAAAFERSLAQLAKRLEGAPRPRVLFWSEPYTAGTETVMGDMLVHAGAVNLAEELGITGFTPLPVERAFTSNPDYVVVREGKPRTNLLAHPILSKLPAVKAGRIVEMPGRYLATLTHHTAAGAELLAHALHRDRFPDVEP